MVELPFDAENKRKSYHFYVVLVDDECGTNINLDGVYNGVMTSRYTLKSYLKTLELLYMDGTCGKYDCTIVEFYGTWSEMVEYVRDNYEDPIDEENWVQVLRSERVGTEIAITEAYDTMIDEMNCSGYLPGRYAIDNYLFVRETIWKCGEVLFGKYVQRSLCPEVTELFHRLLDYYVPMSILSAIKEDSDYTCGCTFSDWLSDFCTRHHVPDQIPSYEELYDYEYDRYMNVVGSL